MLSQIEGSKAVATAVARCRPEVVCAYPISPQTHIVEELSLQVRTGDLKGCEYVNVESEFAAMSVAIGASAAGARAYTATASQGLLFMAEAVYNAAGLGLPIVMTLANRAIGAPINIWNDQSDSLSQRDSGWLQLFAENNQEASDLHIIAYKVAEELSIPVMVCMDGFILTHAVEQVDLPTQEEVDDFLPAFVPQHVLDVNNPITIGAMVGPEAYTEVRYLQHMKMVKALDVVERVSGEFHEKFGRQAGGLVRGYRHEDADTIIVAMGSSVGTIKDTVDSLRETSDAKVGVVSISSYRPFPYEALRSILGNAKQVLVVDRAVDFGAGGVLSSDVRSALVGTGIDIHTVIAGLGGRAITRKSLLGEIHAALDGTLPALSFMDLERDVVEPELDRLYGAGRPTVESLLPKAPAGE